MARGSLPVSLVVGAKGDGIADDTAAIQAAINAIPVNGGGVIQCSGIHLVTSTLLVEDRHIVIAGKGITTKLRTSIGLNPLLRYYANTQSIVGAGLKDISIQGQNAGLTGVKLTRSGAFEVTQFSLSNVFIDGFQTQFWNDCPSKVFAANSAFEFGWGGSSIGILNRAGYMLLLNCWFESVNKGIDAFAAAKTTQIEPKFANVTTEHTETIETGFTPVYREL